MIDIIEHFYEFLQCNVLRSRRLGRSLGSLSFANLIIQAQE